MMSAVLCRRHNGAFLFHAPRLGVTAQGCGSRRGRERRFLALIRSEQDLHCAIGSAQRAVSLALLAELVACVALDRREGGAGPDGAADLLRIWGS